MSQIRKSPNESRCRHKARRRPKTVTESSEGVWFPAGHAQWIRFLRLNTHTWSCSIVYKNVSSFCESFQIISLAAYSISIPQLWRLFFIKCSDFIGRWLTGKLTDNWQLIAYVHHSCQELREKTQRIYEKRIIVICDHNGRRWYRNDCKYFLNYSLTRRVRVHMFTTILGYQIVKCLYYRPPGAGK